MHVLARHVKLKHNVKVCSSDIKQILHVGSLHHRRDKYSCVKKSSILLPFLRILFRKYKSTSSFLLHPPFLRPFFPPVSFSATHKSTQENNKHEMDGKGSQVWVERQRRSGELVPRLWEERRGQAIAWLPESLTGNQKNWPGLTVIRHPSSITKRKYKSVHTPSCLTHSSLFRMFGEHGDNNETRKFTHTKAQPRLWNSQVCLLNNTSELYAHPWAITTAVYALTCSDTVE